MQYFDKKLDATVYLHPQETLSRVALAVSLTSQHKDTLKIKHFKVSKASKQANLDQHTGMDCLQFQSA